MSRIIIFSLSILIVSISLNAAETYGTEDTTGGTEGTEAETELNTDAQGVTRDGTGTDTEGTGDTTVESGTTSAESGESTSESGTTEEVTRDIGAKKIEAIEDATGPSVITDVTFETTEMPMDYLPDNSATLRKLGVAATHFTGNLDRALRAGKASDAPLQINYLLNTLELVSVFTMLMYGANLSHIRDAEDFTYAREADMGFYEIIDAVNQYFALDSTKPGKGEKDSELLFQTGFITRENLPLHEKFMLNAIAKFKANFINITSQDTDVALRVKNYVKRKTRCLFDDIPNVAKAAYDLMILPTTSISCLWESGCAKGSDTRWFHCGANSGQYKKYVTTKPIYSHYIEGDDYFSVFLPCASELMGILFFVPNNHEAFINFDEGYDNFRFEKILDCMSKAQNKSLMEITFPMFEHDFTMDIMDNKRMGMGRLVSPTSISYSTMTPWTYIKLLKLYQSSSLKMDEDRFFFTSATYLTMQKDREIEKLYTRGPNKPEPDVGFTLPYTLPSTDTDTDTETVCLGCTTSYPHHVVTGKNSSANYLRQTRKRKIYNPCTALRPSLSKACLNTRHKHKLTTMIPRITVNSNRRRCNYVTSSHNPSSPSSKLKTHKFKSTSNENKNERRTVIINRSFYYAIVHTERNLFYGVGKVYNCPKDSSKIQECQ